MEKTSNKGNVLLIEDDLNLLYVYSLILEKNGYNVYQAKEAAEALEMAHSEKIDLIITDINLPGKSGLEIVTQFRRMVKYKNIPIVILSGVGTKQNVFRGIELGIDSFLTKPVNMLKLTETVHALLTKSNDPDPAGKKDSLNKLTNLELNRIVLTYRDATIYDHLYEFLCEHFCKVYLESDTDKIDTIFQSGKADLLIMGIENSKDPYLDYIINRYRDCVNMHIPTLLISPEKEALYQLFGSLNYKIDRILSRPVSHELLLMNIRQVCNLRYMTQKHENTLADIEKRLTESKFKENAVTVSIRSRIQELYDDNELIIKSEGIDRDLLQIMLRRNNRMISDLSKSISETTRSLRVERIQFTKAKRLLYKKLRELTCIANDQQVVAEQALNY